MMSNLNLFWIFFVIHVFYANGDEFEFDIITHCRDNENRPVDWWYLYKPPARSFIERGRYFVYLTPYSEGRWEPSTVYITASSMLLNTLAPLYRLLKASSAVECCGYFVYLTHVELRGTMGGLSTIYDITASSMLFNTLAPPYRKTYESHLAVVIYTERPGVKGSAAMGILLADELGGVWISHTVPGLPDLTMDKPIFPEDEIENGHMMTCMTLDYSALDEIIRVLYLAQPAFIQVKVPPQLLDLLPSWSMINAPGQKLPGKAKVAQFLTRQQKLKPLLVVRKPADSRCLYRTFAKSRKIILDIYGDRDPDHKSAICTKDSGIRKIDAISIKFPNEVHYVNNATDRAGFAVSTVAHWQRTGAGPTQYWTCTASSEKEEGAGRGGFILCVENYDIWVSFANLKVKEPEC